MSLPEQPHRRLNALTGEWILVSPHRTKRPWKGKVEYMPTETRPDYLPDCYLCPGNPRAGGATNPRYESTFVFENDFAALIKATPNQTATPNHPLLTTQVVEGVCRVICFSPRHDLTLPRMDVQDIVKVVELWQEQTSELGQTYHWVQVFENKGDLMGCSNPHPHGQIWASDFLPNEPFKEDRQQRDYLLQHQSGNLLLDYLKLETTEGGRIVVENDDWVALVPFWAVWPFETMLIPRRHVCRLPDLSQGETSSLAQILKQLLTRYDNLFEVSFPYSMGWHGAPFNHSGKENDYDHWQLHAHFYPPLLRSATVKKFMVGYEMLCEPQRDITAESAAERLRQLPTQHFMDRG